MSTHDYVIDNQSAPAFRADLNNVLAAIASQNSSGVAPTVTFANMVWYDTTNNQIKKRNESNSAWITLGTIDETAGTFTPSGERALATQAQAEAGTDNATLMTPLRTEQAMLAQFNIAGAAPTYVCRAWVCFSSTGGIYGSANVSSVTRLSTGQYRVNFTTAMSSTGYAAMMTSGNEGLAARDGGRATTYVNVTNTDGNYAVRDANYISVAIFQ